MLPRIGSVFLPHATGRASLRAQPHAFLAALARRVEQGLLTGRPHPRSRYRVVAQEGNRLVISAEGAWTAINVGLNDVTVTAEGDGVARFSIRYWRWAAYVVGLSGTLGVGLLVFMLLFDLRGYIESQPASAFWNLSVDQSVMLAWGMALFWGFAWPWVLVGLHRRAVVRLMARIIGEVDRAAGAAGPTSPRGGASTGEG